jgi:CheY-like chemotaxis protein
MSKNADSILLVEDNPDDAELTKLALSRHGLDGRVTHVSDGMQALDYLHRRNGFSNRSGSNPVLVLLDLKMPLLDGIGVLKEIKGCDLLRNIPVVVLTSSTEPSDLLRAYDAGTNAYIAKPTEFSQFLGAMKHVCEFWIKINQTAPQTVSATVRNTGFGDLI